MSWEQKVDLTECRVLVVDDKPDNVELLVEILAEESIKVSVANDGPTALIVAESAQPDLILLDVQMPVMDGFETCRKLKENQSTKDIPVIFVTGLTEQADIKIGFEVGGVDYFCKPIQLVEALARIRTHLEIRKLIQSQAGIIGKLESSMEENSESVAKTGHELRTPLNSIIGFSRIILRRAMKNQESELQKQSSIILNAGDHLLKLINNMLDLAKSEAGRMELNPAYFEVTPLIELVENLSTPLAETNNNTLIFKGEKIDKIYADATRLRQILLNLTSNACKFTKDGTITVITSCDDDTCEIVVEDTGIGIDEDRQDLIFQPYQQADKSIHAEFGGTGLGLAISYRLAKLMRGELEFESTLGVGSRFTLSIPITDSP